MQNNDRKTRTIMKRMKVYGKKSVSQSVFKDHTEVSNTELSQILEQELWTLYLKKIMLTLNIGDIGDIEIQKAVSKTPQRPTFR